MSRINKILEELILAPNEVHSTLEKAAKTNLLAQLDKFGYEGVSITNVEYDPIWSSLVISFKDTDNDEMDLLIGFDEEGQAYAAPLGDDVLNVEDDEAEEDIIDIEAVLPDDINDISRLAEFDWLTSAILVSLLQPSNIGTDSYSPPEEVDIEERKVSVIRSGKKVKMTVKRSVKRKRLSPKQKSALRKARRKAQTGSAKRNRKKSIKIRKRKGLKSSNLKNRQKLGA